MQCIKTSVGKTITSQRCVSVGKMAKEDNRGGGREDGAGSGAAAAVAAVEKHFAMHGIYGLPPPNTGAMPPSPQQQRQMKHSSARDEPTPDEQDFLSSSHSEFTIRPISTLFSYDRVLSSQLSP